MKIYRPNRLSLAILVSITPIICYSASSRPGNTRLRTGSAQDSTGSTDRAREIELYEKGDHREAVKALCVAAKRDKADLSAGITLVWHLHLLEKRVMRARPVRKHQS